jgi:cell division protein FtsB
MTVPTPSTEPDQPSQPAERSTPGPRRLSIREMWGRLSLSNLQIILVLLLVLGGRLAIDFYNRIIEGQAKVNQQQKLEQEIQQLQSEQQTLEGQKTYFNSPAYIQAWAHSDGKMVLPGEKIVIPLYKGQPRPKQPILPQAPAQPLPNWATWWSLFFDAPPPALPATSPSPSS